MKNKGFTLIEIIAVIIILGVICLIVLPNVNAVVESGKKNTLKASANNILSIVKEECEVQKMDNDAITKSYTITDGKVSPSLEVDNLPSSGIISLTDDCQATVAITDRGYCAIAGSRETVVNTNTLHCGEEYTEVPATKDNCFIFNEETKTITGYDFENEKCPMEISIPATINNIPVEHIGDFAFRNNMEGNIAVYIADNHNGFASTDPIKDNILKLSEYDIFEVITYKSKLDASQKPRKSCYKANNTSNIFDWDYVFTNEEAANYVACGLLSSDFEISNDVGRVTKVNLKPAINLKTIGTAAFMDNQITSVTFGENNNLTAIGTSAFSNNLINGELDFSNLTINSIGGFSSNNITKVILSDNITSLDNGAFRNNEISEIVFGNDIQTIGMYAFSNNMISGTFELPSTITSIETESFSSNSMSSLILNDILNVVSDYSFSNNEELEEIYFGSNIETIEVSAFEDTNISSLQLNSNLKVIEDFAFYYNLNLASINFNDGLISIGEGAFAYGKISSMNLPNSITSLGIGAFAYNTSTIDTVVLPTLLTSIPTNLFIQTKINNLEIGNNVVTIGTGAFSRSKVKTVEWGSSITTIKNCAFCYCELETFSLPPNIRTLEGNAFLYAFLNIDNEIITIPETITKLQYTTFQGISGPNLTTIDTGINVTTIDQNVFNSVLGAKLERIIIGSKVTKIVSSAFLCKDASKCNYTFEIDQVEGSLTGFPWGNDYASVKWKTAES